MKKAKIYCEDIFVGILSQDDVGFDFLYDDSYLTSKNAAPISLTFPLSKKHYHNSVLFPFFDGLIPEGWLLEHALTIWNINRNDRMSLLLKTGKDVKGNVRVEEI